MKKSASVMLVSFLVLGMFLSSFLVLADDSQDTMRPVAMAAGQVNNSNGTVMYNSAMNSGEDSQLREREQVHKEYSDGNGSRVQVQREFQREGNITSVQIQKTYTYANGTQFTQTIVIRNGTQGGKEVRTMEMEREGEHYNVSIQNGLKVGDEFYGNKSQLRANLSNGQGVNISVLPDQAIKAALDRLRLMNQTMNQTNATLQLRERIHNNVPTVVYNVETNQDGRFLGIFKTAMKVNTEVDSQNGNVVAVNKPWWAFLVSVPTVPSSSTNDTNSS